MKNFIALALLGVLVSCGAAAPAYAGTITSYRPSMGMSRSYSAPRSTYSKPAYVAPRPTVTPRPSNTTTVIHENHYSSGSGGSGLLTGMLVGHMMSQPAQAATQPIIVEQAPQQQYAQQAPSPAPVPVSVSPSQPEDTGSSTFSILASIALVGGVTVYLIKRNKHA